MENPAARLAVAVPMRPAPTMPSVAPVTSLPSISRGPHPVKRPSRTYRSPSATRLAAANMRAQATSAVVSVSTSGVLVTGMPRLVQASTSMLL